MAKSLIGFGKSGQTQAINITRYYHLVGGNNAATTTEAFAQSNIRPAGTLSNLSLVLDANSNTGTSTWRLRKNTANGSESISIASSTSGHFADNSNTDSVTAGDDFCYSMVTGTTGSTLSIVHGYIMFTATVAADTYTKMGNMMNIATSTASATSNYPFQSASTLGFGTEIEGQTNFRKAGALQYLDVRISTNARTTATTFRTRKNTANGAQSVSVGSTATGAFEDTVNSDTIAIGDLANLSQTTGTGTGSIQPQAICVSFYSGSSNGLVPIFNSETTAADVTRNVSTTKSYFHILGASSNLTLTNNQRNVMTGFEGYLTNAQVVISSNTITVSTTAGLSINDVDSTIAISISASTSGTFEDTTNSDKITSGQTLANYFVNNTSGSGSLVYRQFNTFFTHTTQVTTTKTHKYNIVTTLTTNKSTFATSSGTTQAANLTQYYSLVGNLATTSTTETDRQSNIRPAGTFSNLFLNLETNSVSATSTFRLRKNTANVNQVISISSSTTGFFEDASNTDTVAAGDDICYQVVTGATGTSIFFGAVAVSFAPTDSTLTVTKFGNGPFPSFTTASATRMLSLQGGNTGATATSDTIVHQQKFKKAGKLKYLDVNVSSNARTTTTTVNSRNNAANGAMSVSIGSTATGSFEDASNSDTIAVDDLVNAAFTTGTGTESIIFQHIATTFESTPSSGIIPLLTQALTGATLSTGTVGTMVVSGDMNVIDASRYNTKYSIGNGTISNFSVYMNSNTATASTTATVRIAGVDSSVTVSIGAGATGDFEDNTNTATFTDGNFIVYYWQSGSGGTTINMRRAMSWFTLSTGTPQNYPVTISEPTISISETLARIQNRIFAINESTISVSEALARIQSLIKTISDPSISVSETLARVASYLKPISNETAITVNQTLVATKSFLKAITTEPAVVVSETISRIQNIIKTIAEPAVSRSETLTKIVSYIKAISTEPSVSVSQTLTATRSFLKAITTEAAITVSDTLQKLLAATRPITGVTTTISDTVVKIQSLIKQISESTINVSDSLQGSLLYIISVIESRVKWYYSLLTKKN